MTFWLTPSLSYRRIAFLLIMLVAAGALAAVTLAAAGASHHIFASPTCGSHCPSQPGF